MRACKDYTRRRRNFKNAMSVLLLGLNHFRKLNEVYGHLGVTKRCRKIGSRIRDGANSGDVFARIVTMNLRCVWQA